MDIPFLEVLIGAIVWVVANIVYIDLRRKGIHGFTRFAAFWVGNPTTWISLFAVRESRQPAFQPVEDEDDGALLLEIRKDREARGEPDVDRDRPGEESALDERSRIDLDGQKDV